jgi:hypothetical protein
MEQEVRVVIDVSLTVNAKHSAVEVAAIVNRGARSMFPCNHKVFNEVKFAEEFAIYGEREEGSDIKWTALVEPIEEAMGMKKSEVPALKVKP